MFRLEIRTGNDAFAESPEIEVARILLDVVRSIGRGATGSHPVRDLNGNAVGSFDFEPDEEPDEEPNEEPGLPEWLGGGSR